MASPAAQSHGWALLLLWGVAWVILGLFLLFRPAVTAVLLVQVMAVFWLVGGVIDLMNGLTHAAQPGRGWRILGGVLGAGAGVILMAHPILGAIVTIAFQYYLLAFTAVGIGLINLFGGFRSSLSWGGSLLGLIQVILGIFLLTHPLLGMLSFLPTLGMVVIVGGIVTIVAAFRVKGAAGSTA